MKYIRIILIDFFYFDNILLSISRILILISILLCLSFNHHDVIGYDILIIINKGWEYIHQFILEFFGRVFKNFLIFTVRF
jgi:hypothetical protein